MKKKRKSPLFWPNIPMGQRLSPRAISSGVSSMPTKGKMMLTKGNTLFSKPLWEKWRLLIFENWRCSLKMSNEANSVCSAQTVGERRPHPPPQLMVSRRAWSDSGHAAHDADGSLAGCHCQVLRTRELRQSLIKRFQMFYLWGQNTILLSTMEKYANINWV